MQQQQTNKPTFKEVYGLYELNIDDLVGPSKMYHTAIVQMLKGKPVLPTYAEKVLSALSAHVGEQYTLENVHVETYMSLDEEV